MHALLILVERYVAEVYVPRAQMVSVCQPKPFPDAIVVDIPDYCGPAFYLDEPTWVHSGRSYPLDEIMSTHALGHILYIKRTRA